MQMQFLSFVCALVALFGDPVRIKFARTLVDLINATGKAKIPTSEIFDPANAQAAASKVQAALDAIGEDGRRGGWAAAHVVIEEARKGAAPLLALPDVVAVTLLLGMRGEFTPLSSFAAQQRLSDIKQQYYDTAKPNFIFQQALKEAVSRLKTADNDAGYLGRGCLKKIFELRLDNPDGLTTRAREKAVLLYLQQTPEYRKFLGRDKDENFVLPKGTDYESFAQSMLVNAYGPVPSGAWSATDDPASTS